MTWEQIYGPGYAEVKRAKARETGRRPKGAMTKQLLSSAQHRIFAEGRPGTFTGRKHTEATKQKISAIRRAKYGTRASLNKQLRYTQQYRSWRKEIFERDGYSCQHCGINTPTARRRVMLNVHHIVELWVLLGNMTLAEALVNASVWDKSNAITLCQPCHKKIPVSAYWEAA